MRSLASLTVLGLAALSALSCAIGGPTAIFEGVEESSKWTGRADPIYFFRKGPADTAGYELWTVGLDGSSERVLLRHPMTDFKLSADGRWIAFTMDRATRCGALEIATTREVLLPGPCHEIEPSPAAEAFAVVLDGAVVARLDPVTGEVRTLARLDSESDATRRRDWLPNPLEGPIWSADGKYLHVCEFIGSRCSTLDAITGETTGSASARSLHDYLLAPGAASSPHFNQYGSTVYGWLERSSPDGSRVARTVRGSLVLEYPNEARTETGLEYLGWFSADFGITGFLRPCWTPDSRYVVGEARGHILVFEPSTSRSGIVTRGSSPTVWLPRYEVPLTGKVHLSNYGSILMAGY